MIFFYKHAVTHTQFLPHEAMLAQYMLSSCVCLFVCHRPVLYQNG